MHPKRCTPDEERTWYQAVLHTLPEAALLVKDGRCIDGNAAAEELFGLAGREEIPGQEVSRFLPPEQPEGRVFAGAIPGGPRKFAWQCRRADGTPFGAEVALVAVQADDADVVLILVREACGGGCLPAGARAAEREAATAARRSSVSVVVWDPEMNVRAVNETFLRMTGRERRVVESMSLQDFESLDPTVRKIADAVRMGETVVEEVALNLPAGPRVQVRSSIPLRDEGGNIIEVLTVYRDVAP